MKTILIAFLLCGICFGDQDAPKHARVSIQYIEVPHAFLMELLGGEETSGSAVHAKTMALSKTGEAKILETSMVVCRSGQRALAEAILEEIYPTEYEPPGFEPPNGFRWIDPLTRSYTAFETKNTGMILEIQPTMGQNPKIIELRLLPEFIQRLRLDTWLEHKDEWGDASLRIPVFEKWSANTALTLQAGKFELASVITPTEQPPAPAPSRRILLFVRADVIETPVSP